MEITKAAKGRRVGKNNPDAQMSQRRNEIGQIHWTQLLKKNEKTPRDSVMERKDGAVSCGSEIE